MLLNQQANSKGGNGLNYLEGEYNSYYDNKTRVLGQLYAQPIDYHRECHYSGSNCDIPSLKHMGNQNSGEKSSDKADARFSPYAYQNNSPRGPPPSNSYRNNDDTQVNNQYFQQYRQPLDGIGHNENKIPTNQFPQNFNNQNNYYEQPDNINMHTYQYKDSFGAQPGFNVRPSNINEENLPYSQYPYEQNKKIFDLQYSTQDGNQFYVDQNLTNQYSPPVDKSLGFTTVRNIYSPRFINPSFYTNANPQYHEQFHNLPRVDHNERDQIKYPTQSAEIKYQQCESNRTDEERESNGYRGDCVPKDTFQTYLQQNTTYYETEKPAPQYTQKTTEEKSNKDYVKDDKPINSNEENHRKLNVNLFDLHTGKCEMSNTPRAQVFREPSNYTINYNKWYAEQVKIAEEEKKMELIKQNQQTNQNVKDNEDLESGRSLKERPVSSREEFLEFFCQNVPLCKNCSEILQKHFRYNGKIEDLKKLMSDGTNSQSDPNSRGRSASPSKQNKRFSLTTDRTTKDNKKDGDNVIHTLQPTVFESLVENKSADIPESLRKLTNSYIYHPVTKDHNQSEKDSTKLLDTDSAIYEGHPTRIDRPNLSYVEDKCSRCGGWTLMKDDSSCDYLNKEKTFEK